MRDERSVSDVLQDILRNVQDMVRSEIRLATVEIREEGRSAVAACVWVAAGTVAAISACMVALWSAAYALASRMPMWAATLIVAIAMATLAAVLTVYGIRRIRRLQPIPERTVESVKENLEWIQQSVK